MYSNNLKELAKLVRYYILKSTTAAGSGHPSSCLSATDLMIGLMFSGIFKADLEDMENITSDHLIFSKGHAAPLLYSLYAAAGKVSLDELLTLRKFGSKLEGHPTPDFKYAEVATGSLGQGLSIGVGMALNAKMEKLNYKTFVLMGDSEMAEGSVWEAVHLAAHDKLDNLVGIIDVNRLGQRGETMEGYEIKNYAKRLEAFGWKAIVCNGHKMEEITAAFKKAVKVKGKPVMVIAKTLKGKGVKFIENKDGWHGKPLNAEECEQAIAGLGKVDLKLIGEVAKPEIVETNKKTKSKPIAESTLGVGYKLGDKIATRKAYGNALVKLGAQNGEVVALDAETSNSTYAEFFKKAYPERFFEMFIAEQNMLGAALGFSRRGKIPFVSTFAAFLTRAADQIRMSQYSNSNIKMVGSHAGVSIGEDGASQMALEDLALMRVQLNSVVLYPSDAVCAEKLVEAAANHFGNVYIRTTRKETPVIYGSEEIFEIGGSKIVKESSKDVVTVIGAGVTLFEALAAYEQLQKEGISIRVIDLYSVKPLDIGILQKVVRETKAIITVEDHYEEGGIGEAVKAALSTSCMPVYSLCVSKMPRSGKPAELLAYEEIDASAIVKKVKEIIK